MSVTRKMNQYIFHRSWMYDKKSSTKRTFKATFVDGVREFVAYAKSRYVVKLEGGIRCLCLKCMCRLIQSPRSVLKHLKNLAFRDDYYV